MKSRIQAKSSSLFGMLLACVVLAACSKQETAVPVVSEAPVATENAVPAHAVLIVPPEKSAPADLPQKLAAWKTAGVLSDAVLVQKFGHKVKDGYGQGFEQFAVLDFPSESAYEKWKETSAGELGPDVIASQVDILFDRRSRHNNPSQSIYVVGQYESLVTPAEYRDYAEDYVEPNMVNQYASGIMTRYTMYLEREPTGGLVHPKSILVTEYANQSEYDRKSSVKDPYKELLLSGTHPEWARLNGIKHSLRTSLAETFANPVPLQ